MTELNETMLQILRDSTSDGAPDRYEDAIRQYPEEVKEALWEAFFVAVAYAEQGEVITN